VEFVISTLGGGIMMVGPECPYFGVPVVPKSTGRGIDDPLQVASKSQTLEGNHEIRRDEGNNGNSEHNDRTRHKGDL